MVVCPGNKLEGERFLDDGVAAELCMETKGQPEEVRGHWTMTSQSRGVDIHRCGKTAKDAAAGDPREAGEGRAPGKLRGCLMHVL